MRKKMLLLSITLFLLVAVLICGCETTKGLGSAADGVGKDLNNLWASLKGADQWMRKNLW